MFNIEEESKYEQVVPKEVITLGSMPSTIPVSAKKLGTITPISLDLSQMQNNINNNYYQQLQQQMQLLAAFKSSSENTRYMAYDNNMQDQSESRIKPNEESKTSSNISYSKSDIR